MRNVFFAGLAMAVVFVLVNRAIALMNARSDLSVAAGYFLLVALVAVATGVVSKVVSRRRP